MKALLLGLLFLLISLPAQAQNEKCEGGCFEQTEPYVQINGYPQIEWPKNQSCDTVKCPPPVVCPSCKCDHLNCTCTAAVNYQPGEALDLTFGLWDSCDEYRGEPQKVCGEFFVVVATEDLTVFAYLTEDMKWHLTNKAEEIRPYRVVSEPGEAPFSVHYYFPTGVNLPSGTYRVIAFVDSVLDGKPSLEIGKANYCFLRLVVP